MIEFIRTWVAVTWGMVTQSALLLIFGFILAGIIRAIITPEMIRALFGQHSAAQIIKASLIGIPLPLCSCSVLPVAAQLRRSGLSREGTVSFLISTPETGVDSIALSYRLLGPYFAIIRPLAALIVALFGGLMTSLFARDAITTPPSIAVASTSPTKNLLQRLWDGQNYIAFDVLPDLAYYLFLGFIVAGLAAVLLPENLLRSGVSPIWQYTAAIAISLPLYVCATSSTPLAAVFLNLGVLPGAILTFLLVGPATNLASIVVQKQILGTKGMIVMTTSLTVAAIFCGILVDLLFGSQLGSIPIDPGRVHEELRWYDLSAAILLAAVMTYYSVRHYYRKFLVRRQAAIEV